MKRLLLACTCAIALSGYAHAQGSAIGSLPAVSQPSLSDISTLVQNFTGPTTGVTRRATLGQYLSGLSLETPAVLNPFAYMVTVPGVQTNPQLTLLSALAGTGLTLATNGLNVTYGAAANTAAQGNDTRIVGALQTAGGTMTGSLTLAYDPLGPRQAATKQYVDNNYLPLVGGTLTGYLFLNANPVAPTGAATKAYVDAQIGALPGVYIPIAATTTFTGRLLSNTPGNGYAVTGDNVVSLDMTAGRIDVLKQFLTAQTNSPDMNMQLSNASPIPLAGYGLFPQVGAFDVTAYGLWDQTPGGQCSGGTLPSTGCGTASLDAAIATLNLYGNRPYQAQDVAIQSTVNQYGHDSSWGLDIQSNDLSGEPPQAFSQVGIEVDPQGNGPDDARSQYDPLHTYRVGITINPGTASQPGWTANTTYHTGGVNRVGSIIAANNPSGVASIYKVTACTGDCTSGTVAPTWPASGTVSDHNVTWAYEQAAQYQFGRAIWVNGYGCNCYYGTGFATSGLFSDAVIDMSEAGLVGSNINTTPAGIRMAANMPIDFSGNGTQAGQNLRILEYSSSQHGLYYTAPVGNLFAALDTGNMLFPGVVQMGFGTYASLNNVSTGYTVGLTVGVNHAGSGRTDFVGDTTGFDFWTQPSAGTIASTPAFSISQTGLFGNAKLSIGGVASLGNTSAANLLNVTTGFNVPGFSFGYNALNSGESDLLINSSGMAWIYVNGSGNTAGNPMTLTSAGNLVLNTGQYQASLATPASSSASCVTGTRQADASYVYVCTATNTWKRAALTTF